MIDLLDRIEKRFQIWLTYRLYEAHWL